MRHTLRARSGVKTERKCGLDGVGDAARWEALCARDVEADGTFVYAVRTTGVYCRPSCPSRRANQENVVFFATGAEAQAAGFRCCKRCCADEAVYRDPRVALVNKACEMIEKACDAPPLKVLSEALGVSAFHLHRTFKALIGVTPKAYAAALQAKRMREALERPGPVTAAVFEAGYASSSRFYERAGARLGMTPSEYRRGAAGVAIRFAVGQCSLGAILVAATERGICSIALGDDPEVLVQALQKRFGKAELIGADRDFEAIVAQVVGAVEQPRLVHSLMLDARGTAFQERVWRALGAIPIGETATYSEIAERIGAPQSTRAVANACGANPVAVAIPCHRVVRADGGLGGYRWGIERKKALLERERGDQGERATRKPT